VYDVDIPEWSADMQTVNYPIETILQRTTRSQTNDLEILSPTLCVKPRT